MVSNYTHILKGANAKAKANAAQGLPELIEIAAGKKFTENYKEKHTTHILFLGSSCIVCLSVGLYHSK